jgi:Fe-S cluster biogenesis protein NfuA/nitrite reductase/ring-hydroxylating ferredoxin subunit
MSPETATAPTEVADRADPAALTALAERVDTAHARLEGLDPAARERALELKRAVEAFHREGLATIIRTLKADERGRELLFALVDDPAVYALFSMHGLVKSDLAARVRRVIDEVRPYMQSHGGDAELVEIAGSTARVRLSGACHGCSMSAVTLRNSIEEALRAHVPEIDTVEPVTNEEPTPAFVSLDSLRQSGDRKGWIEGPPVDELEDGKPCRFDSAEASILLLRLGGVVQAFRNACAHMGLPLDGGVVDREAGTLTCPWHGFRFDGRTGECLTAPQAQLETFPLRIEHGRVLVRPQ